MICRSCGADAPVGTGAFCSHCGRRMGEAQPLPPAAVVTGKAMTWPAVTTPSGPPAADPMTLPAPPSAFRERFALARRAPGFDEAIAAQVAAPHGQMTLSLLAPLGFMAFGLVFMVNWLSLAPAGMALGGVVFLVVWLSITGGMALKAWTTMSAPQQAHLACVRSRETLVTHHTAHHRMHRRGVRTELQHRVMLELEDGRRLSLNGDDSIIGTLVEDDVGVAYVKGERLIGFRRLGA